MVSAVAVHFNEAEVTTEAVLVAVFLLLTAPVAAHLIARAAYLSGVPLWGGTIVDEMRPRLGRQPRSRPVDEPRRPPPPAQWGEPHDDVHTGR
jgi:multicomponent Na+:H+ antiporter subunit G